MEKLNLPPFYVGQMVVLFVTERGGPNGAELIKGDVYIVKGLKYCCRWRIDIGHSFNSGACDTCNQCLQGRIWYPSILFIPFEEQTFPLMTFTQIKEKEKEEILINN